MTTAEIIKELRAMAAQCIDAPEPKKFYTETADRLEDLNRKASGEDRINVAREAILQDLRRRWKEDRGSGITAPADIHRFFQPQTNYFCGDGVMACPICQTGKLSYSRSSYNGHVMARCSTDGCVNWQE